MTPGFCSWAQEVWGEDELSAQHEPVWDCCSPLGTSGDHRGWPAANVHRGPVLGVKYQNSTLPAGKESQPWRVIGGEGPVEWGVRGELGHRGLCGKPKGHFVQRRSPWTVVLG